MIPVAFEYADSNQLMNQSKNDLIFIRVKIHKIQINSLPYWIYLYM